MTKKQIIKVVSSHLSCFQHWEITSDVNEVCISLADGRLFWTQPFLEHVVDICRGCQLSFYIDQMTIHIYANSYSAL